MTELYGPILHDKITKTLYAPDAYAKFYTWLVAHKEDPFFSCDTSECVLSRYVQQSTNEPAVFVDHTHARCSGYINPIPLPYWAAAVVTIMDAYVPANITVSGSKVKNLIDTCKPILKDIFSIGWAS